MTRHLFCYLFLCIFCCNLSSLHAQVKKGFKYLNKEDYSAARKAFLKHRAHPVYAPVADFGLIKIDVKTQAQTLDTLYAQANRLYRCDEKWLQLNAKARKKILKKFRFDTSQTRHLRIELEHKALDQLHDSSGILRFDRHLEAFPDTPSTVIFQRREDLRSRMVSWHLKTLRKANYAILDALYNRHHDLLAQRGSRYPDHVYSFILDAFVQEHTYRNLSQFVREQPEHWFTQACWSPQAVEVLKQDSIPLALEFLRQYPYFILDDWMELHVERLSNGGLLLDSIDYSPTEWKQLAELRLGWDLTKQLRTGKRNATYDADLLRYLPLVAPAKRGYDVLRMALASYQRRGIWDKATQLLQLAQKLYPDGLPPGCDKSYLFYSSKQEWFKTALELFQRPADGISAELIPSLSQVGREEYAPVFAADGLGLYLALDNGKTGLDIFMSQLDTLTQLWSAPQRVDMLSTDQDDIPYGITQDGREFLLAQGGKLMFSTFGSIDWQKPFGLPLTVNEFPWVGKATLSPDGHCLVFEGSGNKKQAHEVEPPKIHLYRMFKGESRFGWGNPQRIDPLSHEQGEERFPTFGPDSNLYFIADRWPSLGQGDVFVSKPLMGVKKEPVVDLRSGTVTFQNGDPIFDYSAWTPPQNLGKEINTLGEEKHWLSIAPDNGSAIFSTAELSKRDERELYRVGLPSVSAAKKRRILTLPLGSIGQHLSIYKRKEMLLQVWDADNGKLLTQIKPQGEKQFILAIPASVKKISYQVIESAKDQQVLSAKENYNVKNARFIEVLAPLNPVNATQN